MGRGIQLQLRANEAGRAPTAVIVMGVSGCGKSTLGALLAETLGCRFLEGDKFHDAGAIEKMQNGVPLTDDDRWPWLDRIAQAASRAVVEEGMVVVACSALRRAYRERLDAGIPASMRFVLLDNSPEEILRRLTGRSHGYMPPSLLGSQFATLERPTADEPARTFFTDVPPKTLCRLVADWIKSDPAGR